VAPPLKLVGDGDAVDRLAGGEQVADGFEDVLVRLAIEVLGTHVLEHVGDGDFGQHHRAEHGLLGFEVVRRHAPADQRRR
jgi:hypothetical protein